MKHFQSKVLTAAILTALSGSAIAADVYEKSEVDTKITDAKTAVTTDLESKINAAKKELGDKLDKQKDSDSKEIEKVKTAITGVKNLLVGDPKDDQNPGLIGTIADLNKSINGDVEENGKKIPGLIDTVAELDKSVKSNKSEIDELKKDLETTDNALDETTNALNKAEEKVTAFADETKKNIEATNEKLNDVAASVDSHEETLKEIATSLDETDTKADEAVKTANEAKKVADDTKQNVDAKIKAAEDASVKAEAAAGKADTAAGKAEAAAAKVTKIEKAAKAAVVQAYDNDRDINGFQKGDTLYNIDENGKITSRKATQEDVDNDEFKGLGLKEVVAEHDKSLGELTETVNENSEALVKTAEVVNEISTDVKANTAAIDKKADQTALDAVSGKVTAAEDKITAAESKITAAEGKITAAEGKITAAEKSITEHGMRLNGLDKTVSDLRKETRQGLAEQAALSGLFQPYNVGRFNVTAAVGGYKSESAIAIGTGFRFTENFAAKAGVAVGTSSGSSAAYHVGVNYEW